jgi:hypothetical protein
MKEKNNKETKDIRTYTDMENAFYRTVDPRRRQEISDARMIQEDQNAMANLSPRVINREFNTSRFKHNSNSAAIPREIFNDEVSDKFDHGPSENTF